jgi:hypothetical protein
VEELTSQQASKAGVGKVLLVLVAAVLIFSPSFISRMILHRSNLDISVVAVVALVLFLVGVFLLLKVIKD